MKTILASLTAVVLLTAVPTAAAAFEIVLPLPGTVVNAGAEVIVRLVLAAGEEVTEVGVFTGDAATRATQTGPNVFEVRVTIPRAAIGPELIAAYAKLANGGVAVARVEVVVS